MIKLVANQKTRWPGGAGIARISGTWNGETVVWQYSSLETSSEPPDNDFQAMGPIATISWNDPIDRQTISFFLPNGVWIRPYVATGGGELEFYIDQVFLAVESESSQEFPYSTRTDVEMIYGPTNVSKWADVENKNDPTFISSRINWSIGRADAEINSRLLESAWLIPFSTPYDPIIIDLSARYAGVLLYDSRLITDNPNKTDQVSTHRNMCYKTIAQLQAGQRRLINADKQWISYPKNIIDPEREDDARSVSTLG